MYKAHGRKNLNMKERRGRGRGRIERVEGKNVCFKVKRFGVSEAFKGASVMSLLGELGGCRLRKNPGEQLKEMSEGAANARRPWIWMGRMFSAFAKATNQCS